MFEHFTFGAQGQTRLATDDDQQASPTDTTFTSPLTPTSPPPRQMLIEGMGDIVDKFSEQSLQSRDLLVSHFAAWATDSMMEPCSSPIDTEMGFSSQIMHHASFPELSKKPSRGTVACRRLQRQLNVQLQTSTSHVRDINDLVSK